jgi:Plant transposon protein
MRLAGQHKGHAEGGKTTLILEAFADYRRYFWYVNFDDPGSLNDLNVLDKSSIVYDLLNGNLSIVTTPYTINGKQRDWMYFLVDAIYPPWGIFVTTYSNPQDGKKRQFQQQQERVRKDIECAFGILISRFHVLERPLRNWYLQDIKNLLHCCVILHNMITEARSGKLTDEEALAVNVGNGISPSFPLFGRHQVTAAEAIAEGLELWAARVSGFEAHTG